jgi:hypothetical protein
MKVNIKNYPNHRFYNKWLYRLGFENRQKVKVRIDPWDTWGMDHTLSPIILPMLLQLKATKQGSPAVSSEDVPESLRPSSEETALYNKEGSTDKCFFDRWDYIMDEMIFAFKSKDKDWEAQFDSGEFDMKFVPAGEGMFELVKGVNHTKTTDWEGRKAYQARISNGFRLFGKYYEDLWD